MGRDVKFPQEFTKDISDNAVKLLTAVNALLQEVGAEFVTISSGWRPKSINANTPGAAKKSYHMQGRAVDIMDPQHTLYDLIAARPELLHKYGLWMEHKDSAKSWCHLDNGTRTDREVRIFRP